MVHMAEITDDLVVPILRQIQGAIAQLQIGQEQTNARFDKVDARLDKMDGHMELLASAIVNLEAASRKQGGQIEILALAFNRQDGRLERIETHLDRVEQRLGLDQTQH